jgi:hypothetical protein
VDVGKYSALKDKLPAFVPEEAWQAKVEDMKYKILDGADNPEDANLAALKAKFVDLKLQKQSLEDEIKDLNISIEALNQLITVRMEASGQQNVKFEDGITLYIKDEPLPQVVDRFAFNQWITDTNQQALFSVNAKTMSGLVKGLLLEGKPQPPGVEVSMKTSIAILGLKGLGGNND